MILTADLLTLDIPNKNGRIYPRSTAEAIIEQVQEGRVLGALGVPEGIDLNLGDVSHVVKNARIEGDKLIGEIEVLGTPSGQLLEQTISAHDFRPRGTGVIDENGVVSDYTLISIDAVRDGA